MPNYNLPPLIGAVARAGDDVRVCVGDSVVLGLPPARPHLIFKWEPASGLSSDTIAQPFPKPTERTFYKLTVTDTTVSGCNEAVDYVVVDVEEVLVPPPAFLCQGNLYADDGDPVYLIAENPNC